MEQNTNAITFVDILRMFAGKGKKIICIVLIAGILCGAAGLCFSILTTPYGGSITLNVSVTDGSRSLITLLSSDKFAERLLLDENGLPPKEYCNADDYQAALDAAIAYNAAREDKKELYREQQMFEYNFALVEDQYNLLNEEYNRIYSILSMYKNAQTDEVAKDPSHAETTKKYEKLLEEAAEKRNTYKDEVRNKEMTKKLELNQNIAIANRVLKDARELYDDASAKVIAQWRQDPEIRDLVSAISSSISCEYMQRFENIDVATDDATDPTELENSRFIIINVSTSEGREFAEDILQRISDVAPEYAEEKLERLSGATEPDCTLISTLANATAQNKKSPIVTAATFAAVGAIAMFVISAAIVIIIGLLPPELAPKKRDKKLKAKTQEPESAA